MFLWQYSADQAKIKVPTSDDTLANLFSDMNQGQVVMVLGE